MAFIDEQAVRQFPLAWPLGWSRCRSRRRDAFTHDKKAINVEKACDRLQDQLDKLGAKNVTLSTNVKINLRGLPYGNENPSDPGVAVYFSFRGKATVLACDSFYAVAGNIAGIAGHVEALRKIERYGVGTIEQALAGYKALPADSAADWKSVFSVAPSWSREQQLQQVKNVYVILARQRHPDITHDDGAAMAHLNRARDYALAELKG